MGVLQCIWLTGVLTRSSAYSVSFHLLEVSTLIVCSLWLSSSFWLENKHEVRSRHNIRKKDADCRNSINKQLFTYGIYHSFISLALICQSEIQLKSVYLYYANLGFSGKRATLLNRLHNTTYWKLFPVRAKDIIVAAKIISVTQKNQNETVVATVIHFTHWKWQQCTLCFKELYTIFPTFTSVYVFFSYWGTSLLFCLLK